VAIDKGHPLSICAAALVGDAVAEGTARGQAVAVVGRRRGDEPCQRAEAGVCVLVVAETVHRGPEGEAAVPTAARALLAARRSAEHVELVTVVRRNLRVVGDVREARGPAVVDVAGLVDLEQRLGLVVLFVGGDRRRECEAVSRG